MLNTRHLKRKEAFPLSAMNQKKKKRKRKKKKDVTPITQPKSSHKKAIFAYSLNIRFVRINVAGIE